MTATRLATIIGFTDNGKPPVLHVDKRRNLVAQRVTMFKGTLLGVTDEQYVAAFHTDDDAWRFLLTYYDHEPPYAGLGAFTFADGLCPIR